MTVLTTVLTLQSPSSGVWYLGPVPIRGYALAIILGIVAAIVIGERRWIARGGRAGDVQDLAIWAVPFGLVGGRLYHVLTDHELYFGDGRHPIDALYLWRGGLGVWGAVGLGAVGVVIGARRKGIRLLPVFDAMAPGVLVAQAIGRWGNWFNQELYGRPTDLPWGLRIDEANWSIQPAEQYRHTTASGDVYATFHPTFLYESLWCLAMFGVLVWADRRFRLGHGRVLALYVMTYTLGRGWIETLRVDTVELQDVGGLRFNVWTSLVLFLGALVWFLVSARLRPGREEQVYTDEALARHAEESTGPAAPVAPADAPEPGDRPSDEGRGHP